MPIIKSTSRKDSACLKQLVAYVMQEESASSSITVLHNIKTNPNDTVSISQAFEENDTYRKKRKGGVILFHDIITFHALDRPYLEQHPHVIEDFMRLYFEHRAPFGVGFARLHQDKDHLHIHVVLSAVEKGNSISTRLSKKQFKDLKILMDRHQLYKYPELEHTYVEPSLRERQKIKKNVRTL